MDAGSFVKASRKLSVVREFTFCPDRVVAYVPPGALREPCQPSPRACRPTPRKARSSDAPQPVLLTRHEQVRSVPPRAASRLVRMLSQEAWSCQLSPTGAIIPRKRE